MRHKLQTFGKMLKLRNVDFQNICKSATNQSEMAYSLGGTDQERQKVYCKSGAALEEVAQRACRLCLWTLQDPARQSHT